MTTDTGAMGRLERVELRDIWRTEAQDFTPWLAQEHNLAVLAETLGMELELEAQEKRVGPFSADILCINTADNDSHVLIENQLERTDHTHLGQLMTYAAGLHTVNIVWVAAKFTEQHRAALDWLNEITDVAFRFFGLEVEVWRIGDSAAAPKFNIVSKPNDWSRTVNQAAKRLAGGESTGKRAQYQLFWQALSGFFEQSKSTVRPQRIQPKHWMDFGVGRSGVKLIAILRSEKSKIVVSLETCGEDSRAIFDLLYDQRDSLEEELGFKLDWDCRYGYGKSDLHVCHYRDANLFDEAIWPDNIAWIKDKLEKMNDVFRPRLKTLNLDDWVPPEGPANDPANDPA